MLGKQPKSSGTPEKVNEYREGGRASQGSTRGGKPTPKVGVTPRPATYTGRGQQSGGVNNIPAYRRGN